MSLDRVFFFGKVRNSNFPGHLTPTQVSGMNSILDEWEARDPRGDLRWLAYMLATTFHETNQQMNPVKEAYWLSEAWRKANLSYYPYYGRGYVQLTHRPNYEHASRVLNDDLVGKPDLALQPKYAATIMFIGMTEGWFRKDAAGPHTLERYFGTTIDNPIGARAIINGFEPGVAEKIAGYHSNFLTALRSETFQISSEIPAEAQAILTAQDTPAIAQPADLRSMFNAFDPAASASTAVSAPATVEKTASPPPETSGLDPLHRIVADIVIAYVSNKKVEEENLPSLITNVYVALVKSQDIVGRARTIGDDGSAS